jgi:hypothetical protein
VCAGRGYLGGGGPLDSIVRLARGRGGGGEEEGAGEGRGAPPPLPLAIVKHDRLCLLS